MGALRQSSRISQLAVRARRCCEPSAQRLLALLVADDFESLEAGDIEVLIPPALEGIARLGFPEVFGTDWADGAIVEALGCGEAAKRMGRSAVSWDRLGADAFRCCPTKRLAARAPACAAGLDRLAASDAEARLQSSSRACGSTWLAAVTRTRRLSASASTPIRCATASTRARRGAGDGRRHGQAAVRLPVDDLPLGTCRFPQSAACATGRGSFAPWAAASPVSWAPTTGRLRACGRLHDRASGSPLYAGLTFLAETVDQGEKGEPPWRSWISKSSSGRTSGRRSAPTTSPRRAWTR